VRRGKLGIRVRLVSNARLRNASRGTDVGRARRRLDVSTSGARDIGGALERRTNQTPLSWVFYPAIYTENGGERFSLPRICSVSLTLK